MGIYLAVLGLLFILELLYFKVANRYDIIDKPNQRSSHSNITLRGGGILFYFGVLLYFIGAHISYPWFFLGLTLITIISFADDVKSQSSKIRLSIHFVAMFLMFYQLGLFHMPWYFMIFALIFCIGVLNAYNFMDGINGLTGGYSLVTVGSLWVINTYQYPFVDSRLLYFIMLALVVFIFFNFRKKARCFSGDVGAISMAFILVFLITSLMIKTNDLGYLALLTIYGVDSVLTLVHRIRMKENIFKPHRKHMYQLMANELKMPHVLVSGIYCAVQAVISIGLIVTEHKLIYAIATIVVFSAVYIIFMKKFFCLHKG